MTPTTRRLRAKSRELSPAASPRSGLSVADLKQSFLDHLFCGLGRVPAAATRNDGYTALALTVRDRVLRQGVRTLEAYHERDARVVAYLSAEFLPGPHLANNLLNLGIVEPARQAIAELGLSLDELLEAEEEPGLGNGGLGRLASCYMDSLASLEVPAVGYGIRYEFGIFDQEIRDGWQAEITDKWLRFGNPWEIVRPEIAYNVKFGGRTEPWTDEDGRYRVRWIPETVVKGVAYDTPILGYRVGTCNNLRLWKAEAVESFDFDAFNHGDYYRAVEDKMHSENITKVLYPNDEVAQGKALRLQQQYFFVTCSLQDMIRLHMTLRRPLEQFHEKWAVQLNDTHPAIAVAELMRLLVDRHQMDWDTAWHVTRNTFAYTNHTLLPEALEKWPVKLLGQVLPRHLEIIYEINARFLAEVRAALPGDDARVARLSIIDETGERYVRMAHLATVGSHHVNGVARLHSDLLRQTVMRDFAELWPGKFCNVTNGVTPRRFVAVSNPALAALISGRIGDGWLRNLDQLRQLEPLAERRGVPPAVAGGEARGQARPRRSHQAADGRDARPGVALRHPGQAPPRVQAAAPERPPHPHALPAPQARSRGGRGGAFVHLRREGRPRLRDGEADHQADQRGGRRGERRSRRPRPAEGGVLPGLQREERAARLPGRRSVRADFDGGEGGQRDGQHEVLAEWRADDRDARRRERRDPRGGRRRELLPLRARRRGGARPEGAAATARATSTIGMWNFERSWTSSRRARSRAATRTCSGRSWTTCSGTTRSWCWPTTRRTSTARNG